MAHARLLEQGWWVDRKRVQRLSREEGLRVPRRRLGESTVPTQRLRALRPDHVWAIDYQFDTTADGRILKSLHVIDEFTREAPAIEPRRSIDADEPVDELDRIVLARGRAPGLLRCDNGPELTAIALEDWCRFSGTALRSSNLGRGGRTPPSSHSTPASATSCSFQEPFSCLAEACVLIEDWRQVSTSIIRTRRSG